MADTVFSQGDIVNTVITCAGGEQIVLTHDTTLPRPYSRGGQIQGTKGLWIEPSLYSADSVPFEHMKNGLIYLNQSTPLASSRKLYKEMWQDFTDCYDQYEHPLWQEYLAEHGISSESFSAGMDWLVLRAFIDCLKNGTPPPIDVYDAAVWMSITCLSEESIATGSNPVAVPDFTNGKWVEPRVSEKGKYSLD